MKIGLRLIFGFLIVVSLIWVVGYFAVNKSEKALRKSLEEGSISLAVEILDKIDRDINNKIEIFQDYSKDLLLQVAVLKSNKEFEKLDEIQEYISKKDKEWISTPQEEITPLMHGLINNRLSKELREKIGFYKEKYGYRVFGEVFVTNKYGVNIAQTGKTTDYRQDDEEWWQEASKNGLYVRDVEYDESADVYSTDIGIRIDDENENFIGTMKVVLNIEDAIKVIKELETTELYKGHKVIYNLVTGGERLIYSTEEFKILEDVSYLMPEPKHLKGFLPFAFIRKDKRYGEVLSTHVHSKGYKDFKGLGWILIVEHKIEEFFVPVYKLRNRILIASLVVTIFAVLVGIIISYSISKPVKKLRDAAVGIGKGELDTRIEIKSKDEIGELASSFNEMAESLSISIQKEKKLAAAAAAAASEKEKAEGLEKEIAEHKRTDEELNKTFKELEITQDASLNIMDDLDRQKKALNISLKELEEAYKELKSTQAMLVQSEKLSALGQLGGGVAHELNSPLAGVLSLTRSYMKEKDPKTEEYEDLKEMEEACEHMSKIIKDFSAFTRVSTQELVGLDCNEVIESTLSFGALQLNKKGIKIAKSYDEKLPLVKGGKSQIQQVIINMITNARDAITGKGIFRITTRSVNTDKGKFVEMGFSDTGCGISKENIGKIFDPFFTTKRPGGGVGLGLSITHTIVKNHNGEILVNSEPGRGTTFTVRLPAMNSGT